MTAQAHDARVGPIKRVLWLILIANWVVAAIKTALGLIADSTAMTADGLHSFIDGAGNIVALIAMHFASQPADEEHPYGHQKFEALASLAIGLMISFGVVGLGRMAFEALVHDKHPEVGPLQIGAMVGTLLVNIVVTRVEHTQGEKLKSELLKADAAHTKSDVFVTIAVISSLVLTSFGVRRADGLVALGVLIFVAWTGWQILKQAIGILADSARLDAKKVRTALEGVGAIDRVRAVRSRGLEGAVYVDLIIEVNPELTVKTAHEITEGVEAKIRERFPEVIDVVVHVEPRTPSVG
ncbi:MAG: cation transporter [Archangium sp.]|nr:cation transporter [Archangium sp.]